MVFGFLDQLQNLTVVSNKIAGTFNRSGATQAVAFNIL